jgi:hypothetical protein
MGGSMSDYRRNAAQARAWSLELLRRVSRRQDGINHPTPGEAAAVEQLINSIPVPECEGGAWWQFFRPSPEECTRQAAEWLAQLSSGLRPSPTLYGYAETIADARNASLSSAAWRRANTLRDQLRGAAAETAADLQEAADAAVPRVATGAGVVLGLAALVFLRKVLR